MNTSSTGSGKGRISVAHEPELQKQPEKWTEPWKELSQERDSRPNGTLTSIRARALPHFQHLPVFHSLAALVKRRQLKIEERAHRECSTPCPSLINSRRRCWKPLCLGSRRKFKPLRQPPKPNTNSQLGQRRSCHFSGGQAQLCSLC